MTEFTSVSVPIILGIGSCNRNLYLTRPRKRLVWCIGYMSTAFEKRVISNSVILSNFNLNKIKRNIWLRRARPRDGIVPGFSEIRARHFVLKQNSAGDSPNFGIEFHLTELPPWQDQTNFGQPNFAQVQAGPNRILNLISISAFSYTSYSRWL